MPIGADTALAVARHAPEELVATRRGWARVLRQLAALFVLGPLVAIAVTTAGELVPDDRVFDAIVEAGDAGPLRANNNPSTLLLTPADRWTECVTLSIGLGDERFGSKLNQAMRSSNLGPCELSTKSIESAIAAREPLVADREYYRYWWTTSSVLRPSVVWLGIPATRVVVQAVAIVGFLALFGAWRRRLGWMVSLAVLGPLVVATDFIVLYESLPQAVSVAAAFFTSTIVFRGVERSSDPREVVVPAAFAGALLLPFELMMVIPIAITLCVLSAVLINYQRGEDLIRLVRFGAAAGIGWLLGFSWLWVSKWMAVAAVIGPRAVYDNIAGSVEARVGTGAEGVDPGFFEGIRSNVGFWFENNFGLAALLFEGVILGVVLLRWIGRQNRQPLRPEAIRGIGLVALCAAIPLVWYVAASNHSQVHHWFMFRAVALSVGVAAGAVVLALQATESVVES